MAGNGNVIGKFSDELEQTTSEVAEDVKDAVGEALEQGIQSVSTPNLTPAQLQQKQQENQKKEMDRQKKLTYTRQWIRNLESAQNKVRMENKQRQQQRLQNQQQEEQIEEQEKEQKKKQPVNPAIAYAGKVEIKRGVGG